jgi:hypothetical protein
MSKGSLLPASSFFSLTALWPHPFFSQLRNFFSMLPKNGHFGGFLRTVFPGCWKFFGQFGNIMVPDNFSRLFKVRKNVNSAQNSALSKNSDAGKHSGQF